MKGSKGYLLAEVLVCLAAAVIICVSAVGTYTSGIKLMVQRNAAAEAFNAAAGAYDETALQKAGLKNSSGKILASVVTGGE